MKRDRSGPPSRSRPRAWQDRRGRTEGPPRPRHAAPPETARDDLIARLARLESLVAAIAAHLGIEPGPPRPGAARRPDVRRAAARRDEADPNAGRPSRREGPRTGGADPHAVVRTVARRLPGRVKQYNPERGFGFVVSAETPGDVFFHRSDCRVDPATLEQSASVTFDLVEMASGQFKAANLASGP